MLPSRNIFEKLNYLSTSMLLNVPERTDIVCCQDVQEC